MNIETPLGNFSPNPELLNKAGSKAMSGFKSDFFNRDFFVSMAVAVIAGGVTWYLLKN